jgi:hypothetical protein
MRVVISSRADRTPLATAGHDTPVPSHSNGDATKETAQRAWPRSCIMG